MTISDILAIESNLYNCDMTKNGNIVFGKQLKKAREAAGFTQEKAAPLFGISLRGYCRWEAGETEPPFSTVVDMCRRFNVSADFLFGLSDEEPSDG